MKNVIALSTACLAFIIGFHIFILSNISFFPYPELFIYPYLTAKGLLPYKQIFDQHFPGLMFFPVNLHTLGMTTLATARIWQLSLVAINHILLYLISKRTLVLGKWSLMTNLIYLLWQPFLEGYVLWIDSFMPLFLLSSFYFLYKGIQISKTIDYFIAGFFLGIALIFKQVVAPIIVIVVLYLLVRKINLKKISCFVLGVGIVFGLMLIYIGAIGVWRDFIYWTVTYNLTTFAQLGRKLPDAGSGIKSLFVLLPVIISIPYVLLKKTKLPNFSLLIIFFITSLIFAYARFDFVHLQPALVFAVLLVTLGLKKLPHKLFVVFTLIYLGASVYFLKPFYDWAYNSTSLIFTPNEIQLAARVLDYLEPTGRIFSFGANPNVYFLTDTLPPGERFVFQFPWFMVEAEDKILSGLVMDPPGVVVKDANATVQGMNLVSYMPKISQFIRNNYKMVDYVSGVEILIPK